MTKSPRVLTNDEVSMAAHVMRDAMRSKNRGPVATLALSWMADLVFTVREDRRRRAKIVKAEG